MDPFVFKGCLPRNSVNQCPGQTKVKAVEVQGGSFADPPSLPHQGSEIIILWLLCPRWPLTTIPPTSPSLSANRRSSRALPLADSYHLCQGVTFHMLQELSALHCDELPADNWEILHYLQSSSKLWHL